MADAATCSSARCTAATSCRPVNLLAQDAQLGTSLAHSGRRLVFAAPEWSRCARLASRSSGARVRRVDVRDRRSSTGSNCRRDRRAGRTRSRRRPGDADVHVRHDRHAEGRAADAREHARARARAWRARTASTAATACCRRCRSITSTASASRRVAPLVSGGSIVDAAPVQRVAVVAARRSSYRPTWLNVVPTIIAYLLNGPATTAEQAARVRARALRPLGVGAAAARAAPRVRAALRHLRHRGDGPDRVRVGRVQQSARIGARKIGSPGTPLGVEARVVDRSGCELAAGERGEIEIRGRNVMLGYYKVAGGDARGASRRRLARNRRPRLPRRRRLLLHHRPHQGADHQGRREHRAARDRRGAARASRRARSRRRRRSGPAYGQEILACVVVKPGMSCSEDDLRAHCLRTTRPLQDAALFRLRRPTCRKGRRARCSACDWSTCDARPFRCRFPLRTVRCRSRRQRLGASSTARATCARAAAASR